MEIYFGLLALMLGSCLGSFVNMWGYRTAVKYKLLKVQPKNRSDLGGRSYCDFCGKGLDIGENIPILGWIFLGGKTRCCGKKLPLEYPLVELGLGLLVLINFWFAKNLLLAGVGALILTVVVYELVFDLKYMILPEDGIKSLYVLAVIWQPLSGNFCGSWLLAAMLGVSFIGGLHLLTGGKGMGWGDVELAWFMGMLLGLRGLVVSMYVAFVVGAIVSLGLLIGKKAGPKTRIPFGPFLLLGTVLAWWGMIKL